MLRHRSKSDFWQEFLKAKNVPCDRVDVAGQPVLTAVPSAQAEQYSPLPFLHERRRSLLSEKSLKARSGPNFLGFEAHLAGNTKMIRAMKGRPPPKPKSTAAAKRVALRTLANGTNINISRGGKLRSAVKKVTAMARAAVNRMTNTIIPKDKKQGLMLVWAIADQELEGLQAEEAKMTAVHKKEAEKETTQKKATEDVAA